MIFLIEMSCIVTIVDDGSEPRASASGCVRSLTVAAPFLFKP